jgi:hypothetical protein
VLELIRDSAIFQAGGLIVVLVEVGRKSYLASIVPVIVNCILNEHQIVVDIVAFVNRGDFPRSRLGEKQRGKILASWVTRKMRTMAQFGIRDPDSALPDVMESIEPRSGMNSIRNSSVMASSLRNVEPAPQILEEQEFERQREQSHHSFIPLPTGISEMPAMSYDDSMTGSLRHGNGASIQSDDTPTNKHQGHFELPGNNWEGEKNRLPTMSTNDFVVPGFEEEPPSVGPKPGYASHPEPQPHSGDLWSLPSQQPRGGLRIQNGASDDEDDSWKQDAIMHMNLGR